MSLTLTLLRDGGEVSGAGTDIVLNDTATGYHIQDLKVYGETEQPTYSGFQQLQKQGMSTPLSDSDFWSSVGNLSQFRMENGWGRFTSTASTGSHNFFTKYAAFQWETSTTYTVIVEIKNAPSSGSGSVTLTQPQNATDPFDSTSEGGQVSYTFAGVDHTVVFSGVTKSAVTSNGLRCYFSSSFTTDKTVDIRITIVKGEHLADWQNYAGDNWQPYTGGIASPSPASPQDIQIVSGSQTFNFTGKNLFNSFAVDKYTHSGSTSVQIESDGTIVLSGNSTSNGYFRVFQPLRVFAPSLQEGKTYHIYIDNDFDGGTRKSLYLVASKVQWRDGTAHTITKDELNYDVAVYGGYNESTSIRIMITEDQDNIYTPYENEMLLLNLADGKNAFDGKIEAGNYSTSSGEGADSTTQCRSTNFTQVKPNTTYTGSLNGTAFVQGNWRILYYGKDKGYLNSSVTTGTFTTPANCYFVKWHSTYIRTNYPNFDAPVQIEEGSSASAFEKYSTLELYKIGDYQDYIAKDGDDWYLHKNVEKVVLSSAYTFDKSTGITTVNRYRSLDIPARALKGGTVYAASTHNSGLTANQSDNGALGVASRYAAAGGLFFATPIGLCDTLEDFYTWIDSNKPVCYYALTESPATPTVTKITDASIIAQLEAIEATPTFDETTIISVTSQNLASPLEVTAEIPIRKTYTEVDISSPFTISDVEGKSQSTTLDGNVYVDWAYNKKQYSFDIFNLTTQDYADIRAYYDYQFTSSAFPTITIPELGIDKLPVYMTMSSRNIVNQCLLTDKLTLKFRETIQP